MSKKLKLSETIEEKIRLSEIKIADEQSLSELNFSNPSNNQLLDQDIKSVIRDLHVHQIELEMQNNELRLTNIELDKQKSKFLGIFNLAPVGYVLLDHAGVIKDVNDAGISLLAFTKFKIVGRRLQNFISPIDSEAYSRFLLQILKAEKLQSCVLEMKSGNGKILHIQVEGISKKVDNSLAECFVALIDITDRIHAEAELAEVKDRLELSLKASLAGIWELDLKSMKFFMDEGSQRICSIPKSGFAGNFNNFLELIHPDDRENAVRVFGIAFTTHKEIDLTCRIGKRDDKECHTVIRGHLISTADSNPRFGGIILDITEKTQMEKSSELLREEYQKRVASAMITGEENERKRISDSLHDSVSQLLYGVKIRLGQLEKTVPSSSNIQSVKKLLDQAISETRNISFELAPSILTDFGFSATIEELVRRLSSKELTMKVNIQGFRKRLDILLETNIYRIVQELINNSMKHSGSSQITIDIIRTKFIEITVKDNGKGYNFRDQENSTSGSGLSSIRNRLRIYNGSMSIESAPQKGTTVYVNLCENLSDQI